MEKNSHHSFTTGFTLGLFSGVVGYYLFGTKAGQQTRDKISKEWENAHQHLVKEGVLSQDQDFKSLGDFLESAKEELFKKINLEIEPSPTSRKKRNYTRHKKQQQFKGV